MKAIMTAAALTLAATTAHAGVVLTSQAPLFQTQDVYETVEVCTKGDDKTTEGAIVGGLLGSESGNAGLGALLGAIIGNEVGEETCTTEKRKVGERQVLVGYNIVLVIDGVKTSMFIAAP